MIQPAGSSFKMIEQPAGCRHDDIDARFQGFVLVAVADAAKNGRPGDRCMDGDVGQILDDLGRQLARRRQDQCARNAARLGHQPLQDRQQERNGLAAARHGASQQILTVERGRNRVGLNRCRSGEPEVLQSFEEIWVELQLRERQVVCKPYGGLW